MFWSNTENHGGKFLSQIEGEFSSAKNATIASGYVSLDIINKFYRNFEDIAKNGGQARLLVGMAFYEGLSSKKLEVLKNLSSELEAIGNNSGVYVSYNGKYHGKIYLFDSQSGKSIYLGSSNFSRSGLSENTESTASIQDAETKNKIFDFVDYLFSPENAVSILKADIVVPGTTEYKRRVELQTLDDLQKYNPESIDKSLYPHFEYPLARIADKEKSNLNVYFGKGRLNRTTGKITPRPWYEVELIANRDINSSPLYPQGDFEAYTDDGYIIPMKTSGDYFKNIRSKGNLSILGQWIKSKLQKKEALIPLTPVTQDTLDIYGNDTIRFYKISDNRYFMEF